MLADRINDRVGAEYSGRPGRLYLIDREGQMASKNDRVPSGIKSAELEYPPIPMLNQGSLEGAAKASRGSE